MANYSRRTTLKSAAGLLTAGCWPGACGAVEPAVSAPRLNQLGFRPGRPKRFVHAVNGEVPLAFSIETPDGRRVFAGRLDATIYDLTRTTGERVRTGDFTAFDTPGRYRVRVGAATSRPFMIGETIYISLVRDAARAFYLIRANTAIDDPVTGLKHAAGHLSEATLPVEGATRDLTGGWYNAGDYGKWTHMAAISASQMMWLHELRPAARTLSLATPPTFAGLPDLLQQARWGLEWLLKMQSADGSVLHKIDSSEHYAWGKAPEDDPFPRTAYVAQSLDAGVFVGVMLQASRIYAPYDRGFAARCRAAATRAWGWLEAHPAVIGRDVNYLDTDPRQAVAWATCAMAASSEDVVLARRATAALATVGVPPVSWLTTQVLGAMSLARSGGIAAAAARDAILGSASAIADRVDGDPYGFSADPDDYYWGSVEAALNAAVLCLFAAELEASERLRRTAQRLLDYVLGCNTLDLSFVTGHGGNSVRRPYHWTCRVWGIVMPGWASGGPNRFADAADPLLKAVIDRGAPPARCFVDACESNGSWASNEGQTSENASLILAAGLIGL